MILTCLPQTTAYPRQRVILCNNMYVHSTGTNNNPNLLGGGGFSRKKTASLSCVYLASALRWWPPFHVLRPQFSLAYIFRPLNSLVLTCYCTLVPTAHPFPPPRVGLINKQPASVDFLNNFYFLLSNLTVCKETDWFKILELGLFGRNFQVSYDWRISYDFFKVVHKTRISLAYDF